VVLAAVQLAGQAKLKFAAQELRGDREVVIAAVQRDGWALEFAAPTLQADCIVVLAAVQQDGWALQFAAPGVQADREVHEHNSHALHAQRRRAAVATAPSVPATLSRGAVDVAALAPHEGEFAMTVCGHEQRHQVEGERHDGAELQVQDFEVALVAARQDPRALQLVNQQLASRVARALGKRLMPTEPIPRKPQALPEELRKLRKDFWTLGLDENSSVDEIRKRYRQLALETHPDKHPNNVEVAKLKFQRISYAYQAIKKHIGL